MLSEKTQRPYSCPSCGGGLEIKNPKSKFVSCPYCGTVTDITDITGTVISSPENFKKVPPMSFLELGMTGTFDGKKHHIIGRTSWRADYSEYWNEEGSSGYSEEVWNYDDWLLIGEDGTYINIIEDREGYYINKKIIPNYPSLPDSTVSQNFYTGDASNPDAEVGSPMMVREYGKNTIKYYEGESTYLVKVGDMVRFSEYKDGGNAYVSEWRFDEENSIKEIEFFEEKKIAKIDLEDCFRSPEELEERKQALADKNKVRTTNKRIFIIAAVVNLILAIVIGATNSEYGTVFSDRFQVSDVTEYSVTMPKADDQAATLGSLSSAMPDTLTEFVKVSTKTLDITEDDQSIRMKLTPATITDGEANMHVILEDATGREVFHVSEYYFDNVKDKLKFFKELEKEFFVEKAGKYTVKVLFEIPLKGKDTYANMVNANVKFDTRGRKWGWGMYFFVAIVLFVVSLFIRKVKKLKN